MKGVRPTHRCIAQLWSIALLAALALAAADSVVRSVFDSRFVAAYVKESPADSPFGAAVPGRVRIDKNVTMSESATWEAWDSAALGVSGFDVGASGEQQRAGRRFCVHLLASDDIDTVALHQCERTSFMGDCGVVSQSLQRHLLGLAQTQMEASWRACATAPTEDGASPSLEVIPTGTLILHVNFPDEEQKSRVLAVVAFIAADDDVDLAAAAATDAATSLGLPPSDAADLPAMLQEKLSIVQNKIVVRTQEAKSLPWPESGTILRLGGMGSADSFARDEAASSLPVVAVVRFCTYDARYLRETVRQARRVARRVIVVMGDKFHNGDPEEFEVLLRSIRELPAGVEVVFTPMDMNLTRSVLSDFGCEGKDFFWGAWQFLQAAAHARAMKTRATDPVDWTHLLFIDGDEVVDAPRMKARLDTMFANKEAMTPLSVFTSYLYFREPRFRYQDWSNIGPTLVAESALTTAALSTCFHRYFHFDTIAHHGGFTQVLGLDAQPVVHHFSWARTKDEMLRKTKAWSHHSDKNWTALIEAEFARPFNGTASFSIGHSSNGCVILDEAPFDV